MKYKIPAVVIGSCSHALANARTLGKKGIPTFLIVKSSGFPASKTKYAKTIVIEDTNTEILIQELVKIGQNFIEKPVLFPTNDKMVKLIAIHFDKISKFYRLNWPAPQLILKLLEKTQLESFVKQTGLKYPKTYIIKNMGTLSNIQQSLTFPLILKPAEPLSEFKAIKILDKKQLLKEIKKYSETIKSFVLQEWIPGTDRDIFFVNFYFDHKSKPISNFVGRKIRSYPLGRGGACSAEGVNNKGVYHFGLRFFSHIMMKGPASIEFKRSPNGEFYVIEPTVGREDFYIRTCIENGVDIPYISYLSQTNQVIGKFSQTNKMTWIDLENDLPALLKSMSIKVNLQEVLQFILSRKVFAYWAWDDPLPAIYNNFVVIKRLVKRIINRISPSFF